MRTLDLGDAVRLSQDRELRIAYPFRLRDRLIAYMAWPETPEKRKSYLQIRRIEELSIRLAHVDDGEAEPRTLFDKDDQEWRERLEKTLISVRGRLLTSAWPDIGDFGTVTDAAYREGPLETELAKGMERASIVGHRLLFTAMMAVHHTDRLRGGASLGKATSLLAHRRAQFNQAKSENLIDDAWKSHKHIAHLAAAVVLFDFSRNTKIALPGLAEGETHEDVAAKIRMFSENLCTVMVYTQTFLDFGLSFAAERSLRTCLDAEFAYRWPVNCPTTMLNALVQPLPDEDLTFLDQRFTDPGKMSPP